MSYVVFVFLFLSAFLGSLKRVKQYFALADYGFQLSGWILSHQEQQKDNNTAAQTGGVHWGFQQIFTASCYWCRLYGSTGEFPFGILFPISQQSNTCSAVISPSSSNLNERLSFKTNPTVRYCTVCMTYTIESHLQFAIFTSARQKKNENNNKSHAKKRLCINYHT